MRRYAQYTQSGAMRPEEKQLGRLQLPEQVAKQAPPPEPAYQVKPEDIAEQPLPPFDMSAVLSEGEGRFKLKYTQFPQGMEFIPPQALDALSKDTYHMSRAHEQLQTMPCLPILVHTPPILCYLWKNNSRVRFTSFSFVVHELLYLEEVCFTGQLSFHPSITIIYKTIQDAYAKQRKKELDETHDARLDEIIAQGWNEQSCNAFIAACERYCYEWIDIRVRYLYKLWIEPWQLNGNVPVPPLQEMLVPRHPPVHLGLLTRQEADKALRLGQRFFAHRAAYRFQNEKEDAEAVVDKKSKLPFDTDEETYMRYLRESPPEQIFRGYLSRKTLEQYFAFMDV